MTTSDRRPRPRSFGHPFDIGARVVVQFECGEEGYSLDGLSFGRGAPLLPLNVRRRSMQKVNRRSAVALGLAAASAAMMKPAAAQTTDYKDATPWPGVVVRTYGGDAVIFAPARKFGIAVGTSITGRPPHRSVRMQMSIWHSISVYNSVNSMRSVKVRNEPQSSSWTKIISAQTANL
jgi:hypothetical protein